MPTYGPTQVSMGGGPVGSGSEASAAALGLVHGPDGHWIKAGTAAPAGAAPTAGTTIAAPAPQAAPPLNLQAQVNPQLQALQGRYSNYLTGLEDNTGRIMDQAGSRFADLREGGASRLAASEANRGIASSNRMGQYQAETSRGQQQVVGDIANAREGMLGSALQGGVGVYGAPEQMAMQEKQLGLNAYNAQNAAQGNLASQGVQQQQLQLQAQQQAAQQQAQAASQQMAQFQALLQASRSSPVFA